jgi:hypothetical protein
MEIIPFTIATNNQKNQTPKSKFNKGYEWPL